MKKGLLRLKNFEEILPVFFAEVGLKMPKIIEVK
jgi:hypothetical protein